jgi:hypothetical protein
MQSKAPRTQAPDESLSQSQTIDLRSNYFLRFSLLVIERTEIQKLFMAL